MEDLEGAVEGGGGSRGSGGEVEGDAVTRLPRVRDTFLMGGENNVTAGTVSVAAAAPEIRNGSSGVVCGRRGGPRSGIPRCYRLGGEIKNRPVVVVQRNR